MCYSLMHFPAILKLMTAKMLIFFPKWKWPWEVVVLERGGRGEREGRVIDFLLGYCLCKWTGIC